jgi:hypothetical protein
MLGEIMKKIILLAVLSMLLLCAMAVPAMAQYDWDVGVEVGDWFLYEGTLLFYDSATVAFPPAFLEYLQVYNETDWMRYTVTDITPGTGANVTFEVKLHYPDGSETTYELVDNITSSMTMMVLGANLTAYTEIRPAYSIMDMWPMPARYLNESIMLVTDNGTRATNVLDHDSNIFGNIYHYIYYWDNETGIQVYHEEYATNVATQTGDTYSYKCKVDLVNSSSGVIVPDLTGPILLLTSMAITVPIVILHRRKKLFI